MFRRSRRVSHADQVARALISAITKTVATKVEGLETPNPWANEMSVHDLLALLWGVDGNRWPRSCHVPGEQVIWTIIRQAQNAPMHGLGFGLHGDKGRRESAKQCAYLLHELDRLDFEMPELMHDALKMGASVSGDKAVAWKERSPHRHNAVS